MQTADKLKKKGWKGKGKCILCGVDESLNHVIFSCVLARFAWICVKEVLSWERIPISLDDFQMNWLDRIRANAYNITLFSFAALAWSLWKLRNKMEIEQDFPKRPMDVIYNFLSCLQHWKILITGDDRGFLDDFLDDFESWIKNTGFK